MPRQAEGVVGLSADQRRGRVGPAVQRIGRHDAALQVEALEKIERGGDLVAAFRPPGSDRQPGFGVPDADHHGRHERAALVVASPERLAVDGDHAARPLRQAEALAQGRKESGEGPLQLLRVDEPEDTAEGVVARAAVPERHNLLQLLFPAFDELGNLDTALGPAQRCRKRQKQKFGQVVPRIDLARITNLSKDRQDNRHQALRSNRKAFQESIHSKPAIPKILICDSPAQGGEGTIATSLRR